MSQSIRWVLLFFRQFCLTIIRCTFLSFSVLFSTLNIYLWIHKNWVLLLDEANCVSLSVHLLNGLICCWVSSDKGYNNKSWMGESLPVRDTCVGKSPVGWHWGQSFWTFDFEYLQICASAVNFFSWIFHVGIFLLLFISLVGPIFDQCKFYDYGQLVS